MDFERFNIAQPKVDSVCGDDSFIVLGSNNKIPVICGDNDGQHSKLNNYIRLIEINTFEF